MSVPRPRPAASRRCTCSGAAWSGLVVTGLIIWITEYYTGTGYRPVRVDRRSLGDRPWHQCHPGSCGVARGDGAAGAGHHRRHHQSPTISPASIGIAVAVTTMLALAGMVVALDAFGPVTDNAGGIAEMAGLPKEVRQYYRCARCGRQHHQGGNQGLCHRLGRTRRAGAVRRLYPGSQLFCRPCGAGQLLRRSGRHQLLACRSLCRGRAAVRRPSAVPVQRHLDDGGGPRRPGGGGRGAPPVPG